MKQTPLILQGYLLAMERKDLAVLVAVFLLAFSTGLFSHKLVGGDKKFAADINFTVDSSNGVEEIRFDNRSLKALHDNSAEGRFFLDTYGDGGVEREISIERDGEIHQKQVFVTVDGKTYLLYMRYMDSADTRDDAWMTFYRVEEV